MCYSVKNNDGDDTVDALSYAEDIKFMVGKVADNSTGGDHRDQ